MPHQKIINDIKNKKIAPVYLLAGEEPFYIDLVSDYIEKNILDESEKAFNLDIFYGLEVDPAKVISVCKEFPMMAERRIVIIKEAQKVQNLELFDDYILNPSPTTVLVIAKKSKSFDQRRKVYNPKNNKNITVLNTKKVPDYKLADWIQNFTKSKGYNIDFQNAQLLGEHLGSDLSKVVKELEKLFISVKKGSAISSSDIEQNIGISKDFNIFELQKAIGFKHHEKAFQIMIYFSENPKNHNIVPVMSALFSYFQKIMVYHFLEDKSPKSAAVALKVNPFFISQYQTASRNYTKKQLFYIFEYLKNYDLKSKGVNNKNTTQKGLLKELIFKILHA